MWFDLSELSNLFCKLSMNILVSEYDIVLLIGNNVAFCVALYIFLVMKCFIKDKHSSGGIYVNKLVTSTDTRFEFIGIRCCLFSLLILVSFNGMFRFVIKEINCEVQFY